MISNKIIKIKKNELEGSPDLDMKFSFQEPIALCKRVPIYNNFYEKFKNFGCRLEVGNLKKFTKNGIMTNDGYELEFDLIVFCTGFDLFQYRKGYDSLSIVFDQSEYRISSLKRYRNNRSRWIQCY